MGGELSVDISGPFVKGLPVTDRREKEELWPRYMVVGAFTSYSPQDVKGIDPSGNNTVLTRR